MITPHVCTCRWSTVNTATIDPPHIVSVNPECWFHGEREVPCDECCDPNDCIDRGRCVIENNQ